MSDDTPTPMPDAAPPRVGDHHGFPNDWETMQHAADRLADFGVPHERARRLGAPHARPALRLRRAGRGPRHRGHHRRGRRRGPPAGDVCRQDSLPVLGVPVESAVLRGVDSLLSIVQMPAGIPVGTLAIGKGGAYNAGLFAIAILAIRDTALREKLKQWRARQTQAVLEQSDPQSG